MLQVTAQATSQLQRIRDAKGVDPAWIVRIERGPGGLSLSFVPRPGPGDHQVESEELSLYVAAEAVHALADRTLDSQSSHGGRPTLVLCSSLESQPAATP